MRIRKSASRLLGSTYSLPAAPAPDAAHPFEPPPLMPFMAPPCAAPESLAGSSISGPAATASGETCELSRSPWDLIAELSLSDPQVEDELVDKYFVPVTCRATWLFTASMPVASVEKEKQAEAVGAGTTSQPGPRQEVPKKAPKKLAVRKECEPKKKVKVKKEEVQEVKQPTYKCKKNDGKRWHCSRTVSSPNSLCDYHFYQKRAYLSPEFAALAVAEAEAKKELEVLVPQPAAVSKPVGRPKPRKKKPGHDLAATEGFYYYAGFGPFRSKRQCRSDGTNHSVPPMKQDEEDEQAEDVVSPSNQQAPPAADGPHNKADASSCDDDIAGIAGGDEESSDDDYRLGVSGRNMNGHGEHRDGKRKNGLKKRWRKPVKARSLKSLM